MARPTAQVKDQPTRESLNRLFDEMVNTNRHDKSPELEALDEEVQAAYEKLEQSKPYSTLVARRDKLARKEKLEKENIRQKAIKLRRRYYLHGPTPAIVKGLDELVEYFNAANL